MNSQMNVGRLSRHKRIFSTLFWLVSALVLIRLALPFFMHYGAPSVEGAPRRLAALVPKELSGSVSQGIPICDYDGRKVSVSFTISPSLPKTSVRFGPQWKVLPSKSSALYAELTSRDRIWIDLYEDESGFNRGVVHNLGGC
jgi:hypothetical protein